MPDPREDAAFMHRALDLAPRGWGRTWPNPLVGCVIVRGGEIVGEGWHEEYGRAHAEVNALAAAGEAARGATAYVTLEPCNHWGKTPPCSRALDAAGIARVVYAAEDPGGDSAGGGEYLGARGIEVTAGIGREAARLQNAMFFHVAEMRTPFVALKYAMSLDAKLAAEPGRPTAITGAGAREEAHRLRAGYDAVVAGIGTVLADDPLLTVRGPVHPRVPPARVVLDTDARLPLSSRLVKTRAEAPVVCVCAADALAERKRALAGAGVEVVEVLRAGGNLDLDAALNALWQGGMRALFVEGGGVIGGALLGADRIEWLDLFLAPLLLGEGAVPAFPADARGPATRRGAWRRVRTATFEDDVLVELRRERGAAGGGT